MIHGSSSSPGMYWKIQNVNWLVHLEQYHWNPGTLKRACNAKPVPWFESTARNCVSSGILRQLEQGRSLTTERNISLLFRQTITFYSSTWRFAVFNDLFRSQKLNFIHKINYNSVSIFCFWWIFIQKRKLI